VQVVVYRPGFSMFYVAIRKVFSRIQYVTLATVVTGFVFAFAVWLPNFKLIGEVVFKSSAPFTHKISFLYSLFGSIQTNFSAISASYTIAIAVLFGINVALLVYYIRTRRAALSGSGAALSVGGLVSGVFGIGCAACGTFLFTSTLALFGAGGFLTILPFGGEEFGFLGVGLLVYSIYITSNKITEPLVCES